MLRFRFIGHEELLRAYGALEGRISDLQWLWELAQLHSYISDLQSAHFASEGTGQWPQLAESTVADKTRRGYGNRPMLVRDATLRAAMVQPWNAAGGVWDTQPDAVAFGTNLPYAGWLHDGTDTMPARGLWAPQWEAGAEGVVDIAALELGVYAEALGFGVRVSN